MTNEQIRQLTDTIYRALFNADGAALRIRLGLPPAAPDDVTDDDLRDEMGILALETLSKIEDELAWMMRAIDTPISMEMQRVMARQVAEQKSYAAKAKALRQGIDLLTGQKKDEKC